MHKLVNGERVELSAEEIAQRKKEEKAREADDAKKEAEEQKKARECEAVCVKLGVSLEEMRNLVQHLK